MTVYEVITARIVEMLQQGTVPWRKPWNVGAGEPRNLVSGKNYRGVNVFLLSAMPFASPYWLTYRQATERGGSVRKGSKGCPVVFWRWSKGEQAESDPETNRAPLLRYYTVFNVEQCDGIEAPVTVPRTFEPIPECERIVSSTPRPPQIEHGGSQAFYRPSTDTITTPAAQHFDSPALYYSVLFHELTHSTGHDSRLARKGITDANMFGSHEYSREELIAEMGAAFLCGTAGIESATLQDSSAYLASWIKVLRGDSRLVVTAAAQAQKAADHILGREFGQSSLEGKHQIVFREQRTGRQLTPAAARPASASDPWCSSRTQRGCAPSATRRGSRSGASPTSKPSAAK